MPTLLRGSVVAGACLALACAHVEIRPARLKDGRYDPEQVGARFYPPEPYLLWLPTAKGCTATLVNLPKLDEPWVVEVHPGWGSVDASASLADGWNLTAFGQKSDAQGPETLDALVGAARLATGAAPPPPGEAGGCPAALQKLEWKGGRTGWALP
jgi:hypothetical protein